MTTSPKAPPPPQPQQPYPPRGYPQPGYPQLGYPPPGYPQPPRRSWPRRHKVLTSLIGIGTLLILIIALATTLSGGSNSSPSSQAPAAPASKPTALPPATPGLGTPVRDGKFQFTVTSVTYAKNVGGEFGETAQGHFALLHVTVKNIGSQSQMLSDSDQYVFDARGRKYSADSMAGVTANPNYQMFLNDINPGNTVRGVIAFDMPSNVKPVKAELHDSMFSNGVIVSLTK